MIGEKDMNNFSNKEKSESNNPLSQVIVDLLFLDLSVCTRCKGTESSLEDKENYQIEVDLYDKKRQSVIKTKIEEFIDSNRKQLNTLTKTKILKQYFDTLINSLCESEMTNTFIGYSIYYGAYKEKEFKTRVFTSFDEYDNLPTYVKSQLIKAYTNLQLGIVNLKK